MSDHPTDIVLVGGGLASAKAAETLRERGFEGAITLVGDEAHPPYERPPLSKGVLRGTAATDTVAVHPPEFYDDHDIRLVVGDAVTRVDRGAGEVTTRSGAVFRFDRLLLATGASPRRLPLEGRQPEGVLTLRGIDDSIRLHGELAAADHVTIVGAGWIGCEVAAAARALDTDVTIVDPLDTPLERVLGREIGSALGELHRTNGVELRMGLSVSAAAGTGRVEQVTLSDGSTLETSLVVVGIGVQPRTELAAGAGLEVDDGILADVTLTTSDPRIFAAGDVANALHPVYERHVRVEHWANALNQGKTAGANLLGAGEAYDRLPYFYSDQYDLGLEYVGRAAGDDEVVIRGDLAAREFIAFWLADGRVTAAMNVNVWDVVEDLKAVVRSAAPVDRSRLADPEVALAELIRVDG